MKLNKNIPKKPTGFTTPENYFSEVEKSVFEAISKSKSKENQSLPQKSGLEVPEAYFEALEKAVFEKTIHQKPAIVVHLWEKFSRIAAILLILISSYGVFKLLNTNTNEQNTFSKISEEDLEIYIENNILPYSEMQNLYQSENDLNIAETNINKLNQELILNYLDDELDDLDLLEE